MILFEGYVFISPKQKGEFGEQFASKLLEANGLKTKRATTSTSGYDRIVGDIKFSLAQRKSKNVVENLFMVNHVSKGKEWERLLFIGVNSISNVVIRWFTKADFITHLDEKNCLFNSQQGGKKVGNDDYMCSGANVMKLINSTFVKQLKDW